MQRVVNAGEITALGTMSAVKLGAIGVHQRQNGGQFFFCQRGVRPAGEIMQGFSGCTLQAAGAQQRKNGAEQNGHRLVGVLLRLPQRFCQIHTQRGQSNHGQEQ